MAIPPGSRPRDRPATEAAIIAAAERLLLRDGWSSLNVNALAAEAGVDRKLIYRYFEGVEGVVERVAGRLDLWLGETLAALPPSQATSYRAFARETLLAYLQALRSGPLILRIVAWELSVDTPLLRRLEAARSGVLQQWMAARRPHLPLPEGVDVVAFNVILLAAVQHLALAEASRGRFGGVTLDDAGWARIEAAIDRLLEAWPA
ncbi:MAG TPA: TetR/AcrR family transcriptional regulator [Brevundimonas sp.]|jgi:AcrR family transcriptional regulator|uniref:TetR/AcrR family transcriptional regulator n=1 Tax=Brevundimonas sp. TaxID=1871086 RepID=UPI002E162AD1|nr:TetR/AcrR family transcriptional regulator [Brevundimonas sp.]